MKTQCDVIVVGGGASGLLCAVMLARKGVQVTVLEKNHRIGKKLSATGNGRCNFTNLHMNENCYYGNSKFISHLLTEVSAKCVIAEFEKYGILHREKDGYVYPHTNQAATVVNGLYHACTQFGVIIYEDCEVEQITKKKEFLAQIERIVPWKEWLTLIQPCYYKGERGNKPYPLETMLRLYLLQNLYDLSDEATVAEAIDSRAFSDFCDIDSSNQVPDGDTLGRFRNLLIKNRLQEKLFAQVVAALTERGLILKKGTIVDSTIISASSSTKNKEKKRDPDAYQVKKGNTWHFGYKAHIGVDKDSGLVHTVEATPANVHDVTETSKLLTGEEDAVYGDSGYLGADKRDDAIIRNKSGRKIKYKINRRPSQVKKLSKSGQYAAKKAEHAKSSVRAKVEHVFGVVKKQLRFRKTRYRGLEKQGAKFNIMFALANLILADRPCLAA